MQGMAMPRCATASHSPADNPSYESHGARKVAVEDIKTPSTALKILRLARSSLWSSSSLASQQTTDNMSHPTVRGVVVITRNGDRFDYYQDPITYESSHTDSTPLGEVRHTASIISSL